ncbi:carbohydrate-binding protein [Streptomyces sp. AD2-2]|nr:carbohydrate-binding protein [Streptomyces sp. AD2-2]
MRITLTTGGPTPWVVNDIRLYGDGPDATSTLQAEQATEVRGAVRGTAADSLRGGDRARFRQANLSGEHLTLRLAPACDRGCSLQLRLDKPDGRVVAVIPLKGTGGWQERSVALRHTVTGSHDLYVVAAGTGPVAQLDWLTIRP